MDFDFDSIRNRMIEDFKKLAGENDMLFYSTNNYLFSTVSEAISQLALYDEYLLRETKWDRAMNMNSLMTAAAFRGYQPQRKSGAFGKVIVSTSNDLTTAEFWNRSATYPMSAFVLYDLAEEGGTPIYQLYTKTATPSGPHIAPPDAGSGWTAVSTKPAVSIRIPRWTQFSGSGAQFTAVETLLLDINKDYVEVEVVEGTPAFEETTAAGNPFETMTINNPSIENQFYTVEVNDEVWTEVSNIYSAYSEDKVYQLTTLSNYAGVQIKFGNGVFGRQLQQLDRLRFSYVVTTGSEGNVLQRRVVTSVDTALVDNNGDPADLSCTNLEALDGGIDEDDLETIRENAITEFQTQNRAITYADYVSLLQKHAFLYKAAVWGAYEYLVDNHLDLETYIPFEENVIHISGFNPSGEPLTDSQENELIEYLQDFKSPTDILQFSKASFIGLAFEVALFVSDKTVSLSALRTLVMETLESTYSYLNMEFMEPLYETVWVALIQKLHPAIAYHQSSVTLIEHPTFETEWTITIPFSVYRVEKNTIEVWIKDTGAAEPAWVLAATDRGDEDPATTGTYIAYTAHTSTGTVTKPTGFTIDPIRSTVDYENGQSILTFVAGTGLPMTSTTADKYEVKVYYKLTTGDVILSQRNQLLKFEEILGVTAAYES